MGFFAEKPKTHAFSKTANGIFRFVDFPVFICQGEHHDVFGLPRAERHETESDRNDS